MKKVSVIGPDAAQVRQVAQQLQRCKPLVGAGPQDQPDGVVAVVHGWSAEDQQVVEAVAQAMGMAIILTQGEWPPQVGVLVCSDVSAVQRAIDEAVLDRERWAGDARRADVDRADQVRVAVRLEVHQVASDLLQGSEAMPERHEMFVRHLRRAVLRQGVPWPVVPVAEAPDMPSARRMLGMDDAAMHVALTVLASCAGGVAVAVACARLFGNPAVGILIGVLVAVAGAMGRWWLARQKLADARRAQEAAVLKEAWTALTADVLARIRIPRVAEEVL